MADAQLRLLGGFAVTLDGAAVPESAWRLKKARELVKLLALAPGHRLHREQAMDVLWGERAPASAANNLHQAVHVARRVLGAAAIESRDELLLLGDVDVDVDAFERAAADARTLGTRAAYDAALALYRGELLPENRYDDWAEARREELAALAAELEDECAAFAPPRAYGLPASVSSFVGRQRELSELSSLIGRTRLLTLSGIGGAGKTRLAVELARSAEPAYEAGAAFVELDALGDPRLIPDTVAAALDVRALPAQAPLDALVDFLAQRTLLLVLDNCEHVLGGAARLCETLLRAAPQLTIVTTSREPLRVPGEIVFRVPSLELPDAEQATRPEQLLAYEAVSLFVERAAAAAPGFELEDGNALDVVRICRRLDGLPLALELAAARVGALTPGAIAERLDARFQLLRSGSHAAPTRQQTLAAALQWSHDLLGPDEGQLFRRIGVFSGGFDLEAAEEVCVDREDARPLVADTLARLVDKSIVVVEDGGEARRYRLLETVRMYARERLAESGEAGALAGRHADWALALAARERGSQRLDREQPNLRAALRTLLERRPRDALRLCVELQPYWLRRIELEEAKRSFAAALAAAPEQTPLAATALRAAATIHFRAGTLAQGLALAEEGLAVAAAVGDREQEWRALQLVGEFAIAADEAGVAAEWLGRALALAREEGFAAAEAIGVHSLGVAAWVLGDLPRADGLLAESVAAFRALEDTAATIPSPLNIAEIRLEQVGGGPGVRHVFEDTLQPLVEVSCSVAAGYALANQAGIARAGGDLARARMLLDESEAQFERTGDAAGLATVLVRRAYLALAAGELEAARPLLEAALEQRDRLDDARGRGIVLVGLGRLETAAGNHAAADEHLARAREIFRRAGDRWGLTSTLWRTADLAGARGALDEAEAALREALAVLAETQRERWIASTLAALAELAVQRGDLAGGAALLADARARYAARDDEAGIEAVDARTESLLSGR